MRLFGRIFISHLVAILVACLAVVFTAGIVSPGFYRGHLEQSIAVENQQMSVAGHVETMLLALAASLPISVLLAAATAFLTTRRIVTAVNTLVEGSRVIAGGQYGKRLPLSGNDELTELAAHFNQMAEALQENEENRTELIGTVGHELRTPLAALQGYAEALSDGVIPAETAANAITREISATRRVASDLLLVARVEAGNLDLRPAPHSPSELIFGVHDRFEHAFEEKGIAFDVEEAEDLPAVQVDPERFAQILSNLLSNALSFTPRGGKVVLSVSALDSEVRFSVTDTGPGITREHQRKIFERFYRVSSARSRGDGGTGVGLTIAKKLTEAMDGQLWLASRAGQGSTFYVAFPAATTKEHEGNQHTRSSSKPPPTA